MSTKEKAQPARKAGANQATLHGEGVDGAYYGVGMDTFAASFDSIKPLGSILLFGGASAPHRRAILSGSTRREKSSSRGHRWHVPYVYRRS